MGYDVIGDVHGEAGRLEAMLRRLGCVREAGGWLPPRDREVVFVGDLIDYGPEQERVVEIVRSMIDAGHAHCVLGNHEFNAIGYATLAGDGSGKHLRERSKKNTDQHSMFLGQVGQGSALHRELVEWFKTLPPTLDLGGIRAVHACWHPTHVDQIAQQFARDGAWSERFLQAAFARSSPECTALEKLTKGPEIPLPNGHTFKDHREVERPDVRVKWWHESPRSYRDVAIVESAQRHIVPDQLLPGDFERIIVEGGPIFVGHYRMSGVPARMTRQVACLDWSKAEGQPLVAYRWDGEREIDDAKFVEVR